MSNETQGKCPVMHGAATTNNSESSTSVRDWWPNNLNLNILPVSYTHLTLPTICSV